MSSLRLYLLGTPRLERDGVPLKLPRRKTLAVLAYLAVTGAAHTRQAVAGLLWPEHTEAQAHAYLRNSLWSLKRVLGEGWVAAGIESMSLISRPDFWLDVAHFRRLLKTCTTRSHPPVQACLACSTPLSKAMELYRGDFMAGFSLPDSSKFHEWQLFEAESLRRELSQALERLVRCKCAQGQSEQAIQYARRWLALDPLHEPAQRGLMRAYAWAGEHAAALRQYQECAQILKQELGIPPSDETTALYAAIRVKQFPSAPSLVQSHGEPTPAQQFALPLLTHLVTPLTPPHPTRFVMRERELAKLDELLDQAVAGQGQVAFIAGEAGAGKTALVREFVRRAQQAQPDLIVASGTCDAQSGIGDPYMVFREVLGLLTSNVGAQWAGGMLTRENINRLFAFLPVSLPTLVDLGPDLVVSFLSGADLVARATALGPDHASWMDRLRELATRSSHSDAVPLEQKRIVEQYTDVLFALAAERPLVLVLDDLHWADISSISLLFHLGRHIASSRVLIVATYRPENVALGRDGKQHPLQSVLSEFKRLLDDNWMDLDQATRVEGRRFVDAVLDAELNRLGESFRRELFRRTMGQALFTTELLRDLQERGDLKRDQDGYWIEAQALDWKKLPARVEAVIEKRLGRLPEDLQQVLNVACVEGDEFTAEVVARVQQIDEQTLVRRLSGELGRQHRLVAPQRLYHSGPQRLSLFRFSHSLFQEYLYNHLNEVERAYLHEAIGDSLEQLYGAQASSIAVKLAAHFQAAGNAERAIHYASKSLSERTPNGPESRLQPVSTRRFSAKTG
jgi:DNA-binding SARP family transcriptional activator